MSTATYRERKPALRRIGPIVVFAIATSTTAVHAAEPSAPGDAAAAESRMAEARKQFQAGVNLLDDPDGAKYEEAYDAFRKAFDLSGSPKVLGNLGFCAMHLERDGEAIEAYTAYLRDAPDVSERERAQIQRDLATITSTAVRLRAVVHRRASGLVLVDTRAQTRGPSVENTYPMDGEETTVRIRPGRHTLRVKSGDELSVPFEVTLEPGAQISHEFTFSPPKPVAATPSASSARASHGALGPILLGAAGLVVAGAGAVSGAIARGKTNSIEAHCPNAVCPATYDLDGERRSAKTFATLADVAWIGGGALVGSALIWYVLSPKERTESTGALRGPAAPASWVAGAGAMCTPSGCAVELGRRF